MRQKVLLSNQVKTYWNKRRLSISTRCWQTFSKGPDSKHFSIWRLYSLCCNYSDLPLQCEISYRQNVKKKKWCGCAPIKFYLRKLCGGLDFSCCLPTDGVDKKFCPGPLKFKMCLRHPNEGTKLDIYYWSSEERSRLQVEIWDFSAFRMCWIWAILLSVLTKKKRRLKDNVLKHSSIWPFEVKKEQSQRQEEKSS